jgi:hypothetical protein
MEVVQRPVGDVLLSVAAVLLGPVASLLIAGCAAGAPIADQMADSMERVGSDTTAPVVVAIEAGSAHLSSTHEVPFTLSAAPAPEGRLEVNVGVDGIGGEPDTEPRRVVFVRAQAEATLIVSVDRSADRTVTATVLPGNGYMVDTERSSATTTVDKATEESESSGTALPTAAIHSSHQSVMEGEFFQYYATIDRAFEDGGIISISITDSAMAGQNPFRIRIGIPAGDTQSISYSGLAQELDGPQPDREITIRIEQGSGYLLASPAFVTIAVTDT